MFLPTDLTSGEDDLVATVTRQLLEHRRPTSPEEEKAVRHEAAQVAAEMIWAQRAETRPGEEADDEPESEYHQFLRETIEQERRLIAEEADEIERERALIDQELAEIEASRRR
jgi:hypothetical protein